MRTDIPSESLLLSEDPTYWLNRAARTEAIAAGMLHDEYKGEMLAVAEGYRHLAELAQQRRASGSVFASLVDRAIRRRWTG